jgi:hypothetical protein
VPKSPRAFKAYSVVDANGEKTVKEQRLFRSRLPDGVEIATSNTANALGPLMGEAPETATNSNHIFTRRN